MSRCASSPFLNPRRVWRASAVFSALLLMALEAAGDPLYSVENLGSLGSGMSMTAAINSSGVAVGFTISPQGNQTPEVFSGQAQALPGTGEATGINSAGTIVGTTYANGGQSVTEWSNGQATNLGISGWATGINNAGQVTGEMLTAGGQGHAFLWSNGALVDLGTLPGGTGSVGSGINSSGQVVGTSQANGISTAVVSNGNGLTKVAGGLGGANSYGMGINDGGVVVGSAQTGSGYLHAFESSANGMIDLGTLGGSSSSAYGINDAGTVVGYSFLAGNETTHAFAYLGGVLVDLNTFLPASSGWIIGAAYAINNSGDILGIGTLNNQTYAVELVPSVTGLGITANDPAPVPEPQPLILAGIGLVGISILAARRAKSKLAR